MAQKHVENRKIIIKNKNNKKNFINDEDKSQCIYEKLKKDKLDALSAYRKRLPKADTGNLEKLNTIMTYNHVFRFWFMTHLSISIQK